MRCDLIKTSVRPRLDGEIQAELVTADIGLESCRAARRDGRAER